MTDLERLWDSYRPGRAPVAAILAEASRERGRRRRAVVRPLVTAVGVTALAGAFVAGTLAVDDGGAPGGPGPEALPSRVAFQADLEPAASCDELLATYVDRALDLVGPWGWGGGELRFSTLEGDTMLDRRSAAESADGRPQGLAAGAERTPQTERQVNSDTGTNVQEAGVDEPDTVKTDGELLVTVRDDELTVHDVTGAATDELATLDLPGIEDAEILLSGTTVVAVGADDTAPVRPSERYADLPAPRGTRLLTVSLADPGEPRITDDVTYDAALASARQHGSTVRLVLDSGLPDLAFVEPRGRRSAAEATRENRTVVEESTIEDWLPSVTAHTGADAGVAEQLLDCTDVAVPSDDLRIGTTSIVGLDVEQPTRVDAIGLAGQTGIAYESADHLYLATRAGRGPEGCLDRCGAPVAEETGTTHVLDFALDGASATHVASGEVEGALRDRWSIDEVDGVLRLAVGPTSETGDHNAILTLERDGLRLVERGRLDGLGRGEQITSVRWFDDLAILVTFREVDPLYAVDLTDTARPTLLGRLKLPGFSSYLHPLGSWRMIGVGEGPGPDGRWGAQVGLFNVRDVTRVHRMDVHSYRHGTRALAGTDPRAFTWLPEERTLITVLERWTTRRIGYVSVVRLVDGRLRERLEQVEYGDDVDSVRAVPMPDGRVVLVTGDGAEFFDL